MRTAGGRALHTGCSVKHSHSPALPARAAKRAQIACGAASTDNGAPSSSKPVLNIIPASAWDNGIPPVMGAHLMASGIVAPVSTSKGPGLDTYPPPISYPAGTANTTVVVYATPKAAAAGLAKSLAASIKAAVAAKGSCTLVLSGGSLPASMAGLKEAKDVDWAKVHVFWVDERNVPHASEDSNYRGAAEALLAAVPLPPANVYAIAEGLPVEQAATNYEGRLVGLPASLLPRDAAGWPVFDLMLLGVGPDGHVASLFPNRGTLTEASRWVLPVSNSPKPPPERITMTLPVINAAKEIMVVALGEGKAEIVQRTLEVQSLPGAIPAQLVRPASEAGKLTWVLDVASAQHLDIGAWEAGGKAFPRSK